MWTHCTACRQLVVIAAAYSLVCGYSARHACGQFQTSQIEAMTNIAVPGQGNRTQDSGVVDGSGGNQATASDGYSNLVYSVGPLTFGQTSAKVSSTVTAGTIKLYSQLSVTADPSNPLGMAFSSGVTGTEFDVLTITQAPASGGLIKVMPLVNPSNLGGSIEGSGTSYNAALNLQTSILKYPAGGGPAVNAANIIYQHSYSQPGGSSTTNTGPSLVTVSAGDELLFDTTENLNAGVSAQPGQTSSVIADFGHTTHMYVWSLTPGLQFTAVSGYDYSPIPGDANVDGQVDLSDLLTLVRNFGSTSATWEQGDFNNDGKVDLTDFLSLARNFGQAADPPVSPSVGPEVDHAFSSVPEPGSLAIQVAVILTMAPRRHRVR